MEGGFQMAVQNTGDKAQTKSHIAWSDLAAQWIGAWLTFGVWAPVCVLDDQIKSAVDLFIFIFQE